MEQCWNGLCFWSRSIEWIWVECAQYAYQWDGLLHDGWKEEHFVLEILIHSVIMCILFYCYIWLWNRKLYEKEWKWMGMWLVVISKSDSISIIHNWKWMSNPANIVEKWVWTVIRHMLYIRWIIDKKNRVTNRVDQYCELQWDICVIEWMMLNLFSDFLSSTFLTTDELRIWYKRINHSIIQSFAIGFYHYWKWDWSIDWLTV